MALALSIVGILLIIIFTPDTPYSGRTTEKIEVAPAATVAPTFRDRTLAAGLVFSHLQGDEKLTGLNEVIGPGACVLDYDNDGWMDLYLVNGSGQTRFYGSQYWWHLPSGHRLYRNTGSGRFVDVTKKAGLERKSWGMGCAAGDLDNDGNTDLVVTNYGENILYRNNGDGTFRDSTVAAGLTGNEWSTSAALADYDGDGRLDIYVVNYLKYKKGAQTYEGGSQFRGDTSVHFDPSLYEGEANRLYRNLGNFKFRNVTDDTGVADASGRGLAATWIDVNRDQRPDLLVTNDKGFPNSIFINEGGRFSEQGEPYRLNDATGSRAISIADINHDNTAELFIGTAAGRPLAVFQRDKNGKAYKDQGRSLGIATEVSAQTDSWSVLASDINNDGWADVASFAGRAATDPDSVKLTLGQPNQVWLNRSGSSFGDVSLQSGAAFQDALSSRGAVAADFDNDGDLDFYVAQNNDLGQLLVNETARQHWVGFQLQGVQDNRTAIGATIEVETANGIQTRMVNPAGFLSSSDPRLVFGLGATGKLRKVSVRWPNGDSDTIEDVTPDRYHLVVQGRSTALPSAMATHAGARRELPRLAIGADNAANRAQYTAWLGYHPTAETPALLYEALSDTDSGVRLAAIQGAGKLQSTTSLALLTDALEDPDPELRLKAIDALEKLESELSARWLLRGLRDESARVRQRSARMFEHFFREEEAMVYRKYLAVPALIEMLDDPELPVRVAAIRALGEAERYRAVKPLLALMANSNGQIRAEAARALGLIREREVIDTLLTHINNTKESPNVRAHCLIALKRLGYAGVPTLINQLAANTANNGAIENDLLTIQAILADETDGIVIGRSTLSRRLLDITRSFNVARVDKGIALAALGALGATREPKAASTVRALAQHSDASVRAKAIEIVALLDKGMFKNMAGTALRDPSLEVRVATLQSAAHSGHTFPANALKAPL
ncbi:MAG: hypothetical protein AMS22_15640, partial [Thiotrichales bacterium SG8_50]